ncbi:MAG: hypothetical protein A2427_00675 [Candidatus Nealsonbacteria bacterium RIFOXYC1_FULL_40_7]|uniref:Glycosyltransferase RgtA/B/C/D-like domain-containing protein n=1 Tax=Candidatus Nealsonbacteria bacterium RIFOXYC1_FULL_40_7 TaxID=1801678 RepID=A0A1G2EQ81_9BACT|nr:MAG: hypothetical protein A2427_00675 [Candidatus Nealsonbacteria bacterium RIFOXYC1_FULL_40_7]
MKKIIWFYLLFCLVITVAIFWPFSRMTATTLPNAVDPIFYAWNLDHNLRSATRGFRDLFNTNIFYPEGNTLAFSDTLYAQTLFAAPIILLTKNPVLAENLYILLTFPLAAVAMFFLSYEITRHTWASALSGIFFAFSYPRLAQIGHVPMISSQWIPLVILFFLKFLKNGSGKNLLLTFLFYVLGVTSSVYFGILLIPVIAVAFFVEPKKWKNLLKNLSIWFIPMTIILGIVLYPYIRLKAEYPDIKRSLEDTGRLSAKSNDYITILPTSLLANSGLFHIDINEKPLYPTLTLFALAMLGIFLGWKKQKKYVLFFAVCAIGAYFLSLGPTTSTSPYTLLYRLFPLMQIVRVPARFAIVAVFSLAGLAAIGLSSIKKKKFLIIALILFLIEVWQINTPSVSIPTGENIPAVYQWLKKQPDSTIIVELPLRPLWRGISMEEQLMRTYRETRDEDVYASETYRIYFSTLHHKRMLNGYSGFFPQIYHDQAGLLDNFPTPESLAMLKKQQVRYILIHAWQYTDKSFSDIKRQIYQYPELRLIQQFDDDYVYEL